MASPADAKLCLDGVWPLRDGIAVMNELPPRVRDSQAPEGMYRVHLDSEALSNGVPPPPLRRQHPVTISRMVEILSPEQTKSISRGEVDERGSKHGLPIHLPGRKDLLVANDDRILPIDDAGRVTTAEQATGVRVLPENHLLHRELLPTTSPYATDMPAMPGQIELLPDEIAIGLPAALIAARHTDLTDIPPTHDAVRTTPTGPADLIRQLDQLTPGQRAIINLQRTENTPPETFHAVRDPDGLGLLTFVNGKPETANLPRKTFHLELILPPTPAEQSHLTGLPGPNSSYAPGGSRYNDTGNPMDLDEAPTFDVSDLLRPRDQADARTVDPRDLHSTGADETTDPPLVRDDPPPATQQEEDQNGSWRRRDNQHNRWVAYDAKTKTWYQKSDGSEEWTYLHELPKKYDEAPRGWRRMIPQERDAAWTAAVASARETSRRLGVDIPPPKWTQSELQGEKAPTGFDGWDEPDKRQWEVAVRRHYDQYGWKHPEYAARRRSRLIATPLLPDKPANWGDLSDREKDVLYNGEERKVLASRVSLPRWWDGENRVWELFPGVEQDSGNVVQWITTARWKFRPRPDGFENLTPEEKGKERRRALRGVAIDRAALLEAGAPLELAEQVGEAPWARQEGESSAREQLVDFSDVAPRQISAAGPSSVPEPTVYGGALEWGQRENDYAYGVDEVGGQEDFSTAFWSSSGQVPADPQVGRGLEAAPAATFLTYGGLTLEVRQDGLGWIGFDPERGLSYWPNAYGTAWRAMDLSGRALEWDANGLREEIVPSLDDDIARAFPVVVPDAGHVDPKPLQGSTPAYRADIFDKGAQQIRANIIARIEAIMYGGVVQKFLRENSDHPDFRKVADTWAMLFSRTFSDENVKPLLDPLGEGFSGIVDLYRQLFAELNAIGQEHRPPSIEEDLQRLFPFVVGEDRASSTRTEGQTTTFTPSGVEPSHHVVPPADGSGAADLRAYDALVTTPTAPPAATGTDSANHPAVMTVSLDVARPDLNWLVPQSPTDAMVARADVRSRFDRWADTHAVELDALRATDTTARDLLTHLREDEAGNDLLNFLQVYDQLRGYLAAAGIRSHPVEDLAQGTSAYRLLVEQAVPRGPAERIAFDLFLDVPGAEQFLALARVLELSPANLMERITYQAEQELGLAHPEPLYAVTRDLALHPETIARAVGDLLPGLDGDIVAGLRGRLADAGVRTDADLSALIELTVRVDRTDRTDRPFFRRALRRLADRHVPPALLNRAETHLVKRALANSDRQGTATLSHVARQLGLADQGDLWIVADELNVRPRDLVYLVYEPMFRDVRRRLPRYDATQVLAAGEAARQFARDVLDTLHNAGVDNQRMWLRASVALGFGVHELLTPVPRDDVGWLLTDLLGGVRPGDLAPTLAQLVPVLGRPVKTVTSVERPQRTAYLLGVPGDLNFVAKVADGLGVTPGELGAFREVFRRNAAAPPDQRVDADQMASAIKSFLAGRTAVPAYQVLRMLARGPGRAGYSLTQMNSIITEPFESSEGKAFAEHRKRARTVIKAILDYVEDEDLHQKWEDGGAVTALVSQLRGVREVIRLIEGQPEEAAAGARRLARAVMENLNERVHRRERPVDGEPRRPGEPLPVPEQPVREPDLPWDPLRRDIRLLTNMDSGQRAGAVAAIDLGLRAAAMVLRTVAGFEKRHVDWIAGKSRELTIEMFAAVSALERDGQGPVPAAWDRHARTAVESTGGDPAASVRDSLAEADLVLAHWWLRKLEVPGAEPKAVLRSRDGHRYAAFLRHAVEQGMSPDRVRYIDEVAHHLGLPSAARELVQVVPNLGTGTSKVRDSSAMVRKHLNGLPLDANTFSRLGFLADLGMTVDALRQAGLKDAADRWLAGGLGITADELGKLRQPTGLEGWQDLVEALRADLERREPSGGWQLADLYGLAAHLGISEYAMRGHSVLTGRVPYDLASAAATVGVADPARLFGLAAELRVDHRELAAELRRAAVRNALNSGANRASAVAAARALIKSGAVAPRQWMSDLVQLVADERAVPMDLVELAQRSGLYPSAFVETMTEVKKLPARFAGAGRDALVAFMESERTGNADPAEIAAAFGEWADRFALIGIRPSAIGSIHALIRPIGRTLGTVQTAVDAAEAVALARGALYGSSPQRLTEALNERLADGDPETQLEHTRMVTEVLELAGRSVEPIVEQPPPRNATVTVTVTAQLAEELRHSLYTARDIRFTDTSSPDLKALTIGFDDGWTALVGVLPLPPHELRGPASITVRPAGRTATELTVEGLGHLSRTEIQALIIAAGMGSVAPGALRALGWRVDTTSAHLFRLRPPAGDFAPSAQSFTVFPGRKTRGVAMLAATIAANRLSPPLHWWARQAKEWPRADLHASASGHELADAVLESARRQGRLPEAVTDVATLMTHTAEHMAKWRTAYGELRDQDAGAFYVGMLDDEAVALLADVVELPPEAAANRVARRDALVEAFRARSDMFRRDIRNSADVRNPERFNKDLAELLTSIVEADEPLGTVDVIGKALLNAELRRRLSPDLVERLIGTALGFNIMVLSEDDRVLRQTRPNQAYTLVIGEAHGEGPDRYRVYGWPPGSKAVGADAGRTHGRPGANDVQVYMVGSVPSPDLGLERLVPEHPEGLRAESDLAEPTWLRAALGIAEDAPKVVTNAATMDRVPTTLIDAARKRRDLWIYFHEATYGKPLLKPDLAAIHRRLEQFAQAGIRPLVFTPGAVFEKGELSNEVLSVLKPYGVTLLAEVPGGLGTVWKATARSSTGEIIKSPDIDTELLDRAVEASGAAERVSRVPESFGWLVWRSRGLRDQQDKIAKAEATYNTPANRRAAVDMAGRMPNSVEAHLIAPLLQFGPDSIVPGFVEAAMADRPSVLLEGLDRLESAETAESSRSAAPSGHLVDEAKERTAGLVGLVEATGKGVDDEATLKEIEFTKVILETLDAISRDRWDDAKDFAVKHKGKTEQRQRWVEAIGKRAEGVKNLEERERLQDLVAVVLQC